MHIGEGSEQQEGLWGRGRCTETQHFITKV